jgi:hypothetical protein
MMEFCSQFTVSLVPAVIAGLLLAMSEWMGTTDRVQANSILHFLYLVLKSKRDKPGESLTEALTDAIVESMEEG